MKLQQILNTFKPTEDHGISLFFDVIFASICVGAVLLYRVLIESTYNSISGGRSATELNAVLEQALVTDLLSPQP